CPSSAPGAGVVGGFTVTPGAGERVSVRAQPEHPAAVVPRPRPAEVQGVTGDGALEGPHAEAEAVAAVDTGAPALQPQLDGEGLTVAVLHALPGVPPLEAGPGARRAAER